MIYERIKALCKENKVSVNELEKRLDIAKGSLCKIDKHKPSSEKMEMLAKELNTTSKFLLTGKEPEFTIEMAKKDVALSKMEIRLKDYALKMAKLPKEKQDLVLKMIDELGK